MIFFIIFIIAIYNFGADFWSFQYLELMNMGIFLQKWNIMNVILLI